MVEDLEDDAEVLALRAFDERLSKVRSRIGLAFVLLGLALGLGGYLLIQSWFISDEVSFVGGPVALLAGAAGFLPSFAGGIWLGRIVARGYTRARREAYLGELAHRFGVPLERLRESAEIFD